MAGKPQPTPRRSPPANSQAEGLTAASRAAAASRSPAPVDWNAPPQKSGLRSEVKLALALVVTLAGAFGYLVHRKFDALRGTLGAAEGGESKQFRPLASGDPGAEVELSAPDPFETAPATPAPHWSTEDLSRQSAAAAAPPLLEVQSQSPVTTKTAAASPDLWTPSPEPAALGLFDAPATMAAGPQATRTPLPAAQPVDDAIPFPEPARAPAATITSEGSDDPFPSAAPLGASPPLQAEPTFDISAGVPGGGSAVVSQADEPAFAEPSPVYSTPSPAGPAAVTSSVSDDPFPATVVAEPQFAPAAPPLPASPASDDPFAVPSPLTVTAPASLPAREPANVATAPPTPLLEQQIPTTPAPGASFAPDPASGAGPSLASPTWSEPAVPSRSDPFPTPAASLAAIDRPAPRTYDSATSFPSDNLYTVRAGDSYWSIAKAHYGSARYFAALTEFNRDRVPDPGRMQPGMQIAIPDPGLLESLFPQYFSGPQVAAAAAPVDRGPAAEEPGRFLVQNGEPHYRVGPGDTLSSIAQKHLGRASRWEQIHTMNLDVLPEPNQLKPGLILRLPHDASQIGVTPEAVGSR